MSEGKRLEFYSSPQWKKCRSAYKKSVGGLCEKCRAKGLIVPGVIVHHKIPINESNVDNASITLDWDNLMLVCRVCHKELHSTPKRYKVGADGSIISNE